MPHGAEDQGEAGFALLSVIGAIGLIAVVMTAFIAAARYRALEAYSVSQRARAETMADSAVNATILRLLGHLSRGGSGPERLAQASLPTACVAADGSAVRVAVTHESGKVDLNTAQADLVAALVKGTMGESQSRAVVRGILSLRGSETAKQPRAAFESALQVGQMPGIDRRLFATLLPLVTVHSGSPGLHARLASAEVLAAISGQSDPAIAQRRHAAFFLADVPGPMVQITAEARTGHGVRFARTAIVEFLRDRPVSHRVREWREGAPPPGEPPARSPPPC